MKKSKKFSPEVRERAVRMVQGHRGECPSLWAAIESIAPEIGCWPQTLTEWVKRDDIDTGNKARFTTTGLPPVSRHSTPIQTICLPAQAVRMLSACCISHP